VFIKNELSETKLHFKMDTFVPKQVSIKWHDISDKKNICTSITSHLYWNNQSNAKQIL